MKERNSNKTSNFIYTVFLDSTVRFLVPKSALGSKGRINSMTYVILFQIVLIVCQLFFLGYSVLSSIQN